MEIPLFLAMTAAEFQAAQTLPPHPAWMACHFSSYGRGLSNIPAGLPVGSVLMLNDRTPVRGHDPALVAKLLHDTAKKLECAAIVLDFQRPDCDELPEIIRAVLDHADRPIAVSALYAADFDCPVLIPPIPPHILPEEAVALWKGRELWLEVSPEGTEICVTEAGSQYAPLPHYCPEDTTHRDQELHCHYEIFAEEDQVLFWLGRTEEDRISFIHAVKALGVTHTLGLWQEMQQ